MKTPVVALAAISLVLTSTTMTNAHAGDPAVMPLGAAACDAPARRTPRQRGADVEPWTATRCPSAALAAL
ncbi:hypothetical protein [Sorangium sp. So ce176]|uniref:hypothetical protein n=1 Tax=Sorangium sp. So ce176 TaxID=3133286 RepID=UPI003F5DAFE3